MELFLIKNDKDHERALALIEQNWDSDLKETDRLRFEIMCELVDAWESRNVWADPGDPTELLRAKLREVGWSQRELARQLGWSSSGRVSEILNGKRPLTLNMVRHLSAVLSIPPGLLVHDVRENEMAGTWVRLSSSTARWAQATAVSHGQTLHQFVESKLTASNAGERTQESAQLGILYGLTSVRSSEYSDALGTQDVIIGDPFSQNEQQAAA